MPSSKEGMVNRKRSNDDNDFVRTPPPHISTVVQIQAEPFLCLNTRFPPERLIQIVELLTAEQRYIVASNGSKEDKTHPLIFWTTERLKERELQEIAKGRFGNVVFSSAFTNINKGVQGCAYLPLHRGSDPIKGEPNDVDGAMNKISDHMNLQVQDIYV